jgi:ubiquinone biosynthesis protein COQ9
MELLRRDLPERTFEFAPRFGWENRMILETLEAANLAALEILAGME